MDPKQPKSVDLAEVERLVEALERDLAKVRGGSKDLDALRGEVEQLRAALASSDAAHGEVHKGLHGLRSALHEAGDELVRDALQASDYLARIGRMLGM
jgi:hypothetical protein